MCDRCRCGIQAGVARRFTGVRDLAVCADLSVVLCQPAMCMVSNTLT